MAFEFRQPENQQGLKVGLISEMVSNLFYPNDKTGESKKNFKNLVEQAF